MSDIPIETEIVEAGSARFNRKEKYLAAIGAAICFGGFWLAGKLFRIPVETHFSVSLLEQGSPGIAVLVTVVVFAASVALGGVIAGVIGYDAGLLCAGAGLCALSARGGPIRYILFYNPAPSVWGVLIGETALLCAIVWGGTFVQSLLHRAGVLQHDDHRHVVTEVHESLNERILALVINVVVTGILMMLFTPTDRKVQVLGAVFLATLLGTLAAYQVFPTRPSIWYWAAPFIVAAIGYAIEYLGGDRSGWNIGEVRGPLAGLARPLPLDYAGAGVPAAILAYWISRRWQHEREIESLTGSTGG